MQFVSATMTGSYGQIHNNQLYTLYLAGHREAGVMIMIQCNRKDKTEIMQLDMNRESI